MRRKRLKKSNETLSISIPPEVIGEVVKLADRDARTISGMISILLREALQARLEKGVIDA